MTIRSNMIPDSTEEGNRTDWFLREHGRFPSVLELIAIREHRQDVRADARLFL